jgi:hypothetical protein
VMMATERYEALLDELADLRIESIARVRANTPRKDYLSRKEMTAFVDSL